MPQKPKFTLAPLEQADEPIGQRLARIRKARGLTQKQVAEKIGIKQVLVSDYERGRLRINADMLARFAVVLGVSADEILGLNQDELPEVIYDNKLLQRVEQIQCLPSKQRKAILRTLDMLIKGATTADG